MRPPHRILSAVHVLAVVVVLVVLSLSLNGCHRKPKLAENAPRRVYFITIDTLRADHMSLYGYPRATSPKIDALARSGVVFDRAVTQWPKTGVSFASMFTGEYPQTTGLIRRAALRIPESYLTLPELFHESGYTTLGVISNAVLAAKFGWNTGFDEFQETWGGGDFPEDPQLFRDLVHAPRVNDLALPMLEKHAKDERLFAWIHYSDPHAPYLLPQGFANPFLNDALYRQQAGGAPVPRKVTRGYKLGEREDLNYYVAQYDANVLVADTYIGRLLDRLRALGMLQDSLIVIAADHGESLGEHGSYFEHGPLPYNTTAHVPLLFVRYGRDGKPLFTVGRRVVRPVELVDLYPTFRDLIVPDREVSGLEGHGLTAFLLPGSEEPPNSSFRYAFSEAGEKPRYFRSVQDGRWKLVLGTGGRHPRPVAGPSGLELYDLVADPLETRNLAALNSEELRRLRRELIAWTRATAGHDAGGKEDAETLKALKALGYAN